MTLTASYFLTVMGSKNLSRLGAVKKLLSQENKRQHIHLFFSLSQRKTHAKKGTKTKGLRI